MKNLNIPTLKGETFKPIIEYDGLYYVSDFGRVFSRNKNLILNQRLVSVGYWGVALKFNGKWTFPIVSRLEAIAFIPNPENKSDVNHINGIRTDNRLSNLEWNTRAENIAHSFRMELSNRNGKPIIGKPINGGDTMYFESCKAGAEFFGFNKTYMARCVREGISTRGYLWTFIDVENKIFTHKIINTESNYFGHWLALSKKPSGITVHKAIGKTEHIAISNFLEN